MAESEADNEEYYDNGTLGPQRKLFYREMIARFGHHCGVEWDIGEENDYTTTQHENFAAYLTDVDPYDTSVTTHTQTADSSDNTWEDYYGPLLGNGDFEMTAFQGRFEGLDLAQRLWDWRQRSVSNGAPWVISLDEPQAIENTSNQSTGLPHGRMDFMWPAYMGGAGGFEWYIRSGTGSHNYDQNIDDFSEIQAALNWSLFARQFFFDTNFPALKPNHSAIDGGLMMSDPGSAHVVYLPAGGNATVDIGSGTWTVDWYNPRRGVYESTTQVSGGTGTSLGTPPISGDVAAHLSPA